MFEAYLRSQDKQARGGQIIDTTLFNIPKQRNIRGENAEIKAGRLPHCWDENQDRLRQKNLNARWIKKNSINYCGYKNSICIDVDHCFIRRYAMTPKISIAARRFHTCRIPKMSTTLYGLIRRIQANASRIC